MVLQETTRKQPEVHDSDATLHDSTPLPQVVAARLFGSHRTGCPLDTD